MSNTFARKKPEQYVAKQTVRRVPSVCVCNEIFEVPILKPDTLKSGGISGSFKSVRKPVKTYYLKNVNCNCMTSQYSKYKTKCRCNFQISTSKKWLPGKLVKHEGKTFRVL